MPLVDFNPISLACGYNGDVTRFNKEQNTNILTHSTFLTINSLEVVKGNINHIVNDLKSKIGNIGWDNFEYSRDVINYEFNMDLWKLRHALCYQLLIYTYYKSVSDAFTQNEIGMFKLGIFGSVTPTSDIDIGFQYAKKKDRISGIIAHVVKTFEDAFIELTGKYSLGYDIEPYADMMYLDDADGGIFYCDSSTFTTDDLLEIMPAIGASIIRNVIQSQIDSDSNNYTDVRRHKTQINKQLGGTVENIKTRVNAFEFSEIINYFNSTDYFKPLNTNNEFNNILKQITNKDWLIKSKQNVIEYMTVTYDESRTIYYKKVREVEVLLNSIDLNREIVISNKIILELMKAIANALVFRAESYVSPSTVMHVVRVMQANELLSNNEKCNLKIKKSKAQCAIGKIGYAMSCLEQIGYLYRFNTTYCQDKLLNGGKNIHADNEKCNKKIKKYLPRLQDGITRISLIEKSNLNTNVKKTKNKILNASTNKPAFRGGKHFQRYSKKLVTPLTILNIHRCKKVNTRRRKRSSIQN